MLFTSILENDLIIMKNIKLASNILKLGGGMLFASSFFMVDDRDSVLKRRYLSLGLFATGLLIDYTLYLPKLRSKLKKVKTK